MVPGTEVELREFVEARATQEGAHLDFKAELRPGDAGTRSLAADLASLAIDGGIIIVGVTDRPARLAPLALGGMRERVEQVARDRVDPPLSVRVREIPSEDLERGYLVIEVPASTTAPHAVDGIFRGRTGSTNTRLTAAEVQALMTTRTATGPTSAVLLDELAANDPTPPDGRDLGRLLVVAQPRGGDSEMLQTAVGEDWEGWTRRMVTEGPRVQPAWSPDVHQLHAAARVPGGWTVSSFRVPIRNDDRFYEADGLLMRFGEDGRVSLFCSRGTGIVPSGPVIIEVVIAGLVLRVGLAVAAVTQATGFDGTWDVGMRLAGISGAVSHFRLDNWWVDREELPPYPDATYERVAVVQATEVLAAPEVLAERLFGALNRTLTHGKMPLPKVV